MARRKSKRKAKGGWTRLLLGLLVTSAAGVGGLFTLREYLNRRPLHLEPVTERLAARFEQTLQDSLVPGDAIRLRSLRTEQSRDAVWNVYQYDVEIPPTLALSRVGELLRRNLAAEHAVVQDMQRGDNEVALSLHVAGHEFLIARLHTSGQPEPEPSKAPILRDEKTRDDEVLNSPEEPPHERWTALLPWSWLPDEWPWGGGTPDVVAPERPRLAIILDDGGYGGAATDAVLALDPRFTLSILPYAPESLSTAERGAAAGFQIMLHMPMESSNPSESFEGSLLTTMTAGEMDDLLVRALAQVPHAAGVNNHTGSKFSETKPAVVRMMEALRKRGLFFIDSRTTHTTVAMATACELGVPAAERDVFLDHENTREFILAQWDALISMCLERGHAVGIGHFRSLTLDVLAQKLPELEDLGIELVHAGDLATCTMD